MKNTSDLAELPRSTPGLPRAYVVREPDEERATVVYASNPMQARRLGHGRDDVGAMCCEDELLVERAEYLDHLEGRSVTEVQLANGWWFECWHCQERVDGDSAEALVRRNEVYCSEWCRGAEVVRHVQRRIDVWEAVAWAVDRYPGVRVESVCTLTLGTDARRRMIPTVRLRVPPRFEHVFSVQRGQTMLVTEAAAAEWNDSPATLVARTDQR